MDFPVRGAHLMKAHLAIKHRGQFAEERIFVVVANDDRFLDAGELLDARRVFFQRRRLAIVIGMQIVAERFLTASAIITVFHGKADACLICP